MTSQLNLPLMIIEFILAIGFLAFIHEFGHFIAARIFRVEVEEFGLGFPPRMVKLFNWKGTDFTLNWIPFGAFVRPKGENDPEVEGGLAAANPWARLVVLFSGPLMNLIVGIILFSVVFSKIGAPNSSIVQIVDVAPGSPAQEAGLLPNDIIVSINDNIIDSMQTISSVVQENLGEEISIIYERDDQQNTTSAIPRVNPPEGEGALGIVMGNPYMQISWLEALPLSTQVTIEQARQLIMMPVMLIRNQIPAEQARVVGVKGMFDIYQQAREEDIETTSTNQVELPAVNTVWFLAVLSVAFGLTNLLPIPALDGGRILFVLPEITIGKRVPAQYENFIHLIGFTALIILMVYITTQDIINPIVLP